MERKTTTSGCQTSNEEQENEQDTREDLDSFYIDSYRVKHISPAERNGTHPDRTGKYTKKFR